jgi:hypothetical protein
MAELAKTYHNNLQSEDCTQPNDKTRAAQVEIALNAIPNSQKLKDPENSPLNTLITENSIEKALKKAKNKSATGMDGCPYELWKKLKQRYDDNKKNQKEGFNIIKVLTKVFNDIQIHGVEKHTDFALGWMCPIYKKKDHIDISNYRPITLLNTDYKTLTKALALQLMNNLESMIHPDQAGFIPKRSIFNQIRLASTIISYAEATEKNGTLVALDQEKAYNKIKHDYLWAMLNKFNLPPIHQNSQSAIPKCAHACNDKWNTQLTLQSNPQCMTR